MQSNMQQLLYTASNGQSEKLQLTLTSHVAKELNLIWTDFKTATVHM